MNAELLTSIDWPNNPTLENVGDAVGAARGLCVVLSPIPSDLQHAEVSGLTVIIGSTAHVYYDSELSPLNRIQTVMHEYAHILLGDVCAEEYSLHRTTFDDPREQRAEETGMKLMIELRRRRRRRSDMLEFLSGGSKAL
ncbi:ImmA/IrrE family metallo-endopeptidase [Streptomyces sp. NRRL F-5053]|uniref:ImmA/IrrE family metallo-endopeptidase n=1 Tax=Streptomyces sp. NRRL F-5053 TaxID=1463854 RepID=UPI0004C8F47C|nr:ImmA/IrrE family metallo-endopeptidase [Streptomyces sp. NRRL F-5053]